MSKFPEYLDAALDKATEIDWTWKETSPKAKSELCDAIERYKDVAVIKAVEALKARVKAALEGGK